jgi:Ca2+-binding EF-hand superfamily protein
VVNVKPSTDTKMKTYAFLENQTWKKQLQQNAALTLLKHNEIIYSRINKVETAESRILAEQKEHIRNIAIGTTHMGRLKAISRQRDVDRIQRENAHIKERLSKVKPFYSKKLFDESFQHHRNFVKGRRTDNTAGHIIRCPRKLQAGPLPPVHASLTLGSTLSSPIHPSLRSKTSPLPLGDIRSRSAGQLGAPSSSMSVVSSSDSVSLLEVPERLRSSLYSKGNDSTIGDEEEEEEDEYYESERDDCSEGGMSDQDRDIFDEEPESITASSLLGGNVPVIDQDRTKLISKTQSIIIEEESDDLANDYYVLATRPQPVAGESANCLLRVYTKKAYDENLLIRAMTVMEPYRVLAERSITIDQAYDSISHANIKPATTEDLQSLRGMLVTMFQEADAENNGYLTYDEFQTLMERIEVGISSQELRFVIAEADENENGFIDYHEFVPLAVDMIQAFRARARAKSTQELMESAVEDEVLQKVNREEVQRIAQAFFDRVKSYDTAVGNRAAVGALRPSELRKCLKSLAQSSGLTNSEINMIAQSLPKDPFGRLVYKDFRNVLYKVKIAAMRNMVLESQGSDIHRYIMQMCRDEEKALAALDVDARSRTSHADKEDDSNLTGWLPLRSLINIMIASPRLSLSRLQVMVIASEAQLVDGRVNYLHFAPVAAKTIELMFEPKALRQRAELIETSDLSPEVLLNGTSPELFVSRLKSLFKSYDIEKKGELNAKQFRAMLESMDLQLSPGEILSLMAIADYNNNGYISFDEFCEFCMNNLLHLEREKHIRLLQKAIHGTVHQTDAERDGQEIQDFENHLKSIFYIADKDNNGTLEYDELENLFLSLNIHLSQFQLYMLMSECDTNGDGHVDYQEFIPVMVDILEAAKAKYHAVEEKEKREQVVKEKVLQLSASWDDEVRTAAEHFRREFDVIETIADTEVQRSMLVEAAKNPRNGLNRTEANMFVAEILRSDKSKHSSIIDQLAGRESKLRDEKTRYQRSQKELYDIIKAIRMATLMRGMLDDVHPSALAKHLLAKFADEAEKIRIQRGSSEPVFFLPVKNITDVLEKTTMLRLHLAQIMTLISWADSFQSPGVGIDYREFAYYAADLIVKMFDTNELQKRANVIGSVVDASSAMRGAARESVEEHLVRELSSAVSADGMVSQEVLVEAIRSIPKLHLSEREASAVMSGAEMDAGGMYDWRAFVPWAYGCVRAVCMERMIGRRVTLMAAQSTVEEDHVNLLKLGENIVDMVTVRKSGGKYSINFASENVTRSSRKSSLLVVKSKIESLVKPGMDGIAEEEESVGDIQQDCYDILRTGTFLPLHGPSKDPALEKGLFCMVRVAENDPILRGDMPPLIATAVSCDCKYNMSLPLPLRLPSLGLVDQDAAEQFALNLVSRMHIAFDKKGVLTLNFEPDAIP